MTRKDTMENIINDNEVGAMLKLAEQMIWRLVPSGIYRFTKSGRRYGLGWYWARVVQFTCILYFIMTYLAFLSF